ncbi:MAG: histidine phosphatase family protein, partial [Pseudomonadota bacterium]
ALRRERTFIDMRLSSLVRFLIALCVFAPAAPSPAQMLNADAFWAALSQPGVHVIMRHALAPGSGDPADFDIDDPSTQRRLSDAGREQSRAIGAAFRARGVAFDAVLTSQWDRCRETADLLGLGEPNDFPPLNSFFQDRSAGPEQTAALRAYLADLQANRQVMLVTHWVNIGALLGSGPRSGEAVAFRLSSEGEIERLGSLAIPAS